MVNNKKMSKSTIAVILLSLLLCLSLILTATGAWFTDKDNGAGKELVFGQVEIAVNDATDGCGYSAAKRSAKVEGVDIMPGDTLAAKFKVSNTYEPVYIKITMGLTGAEVGSGTLTLAEPAGTSKLVYDSTNKCYYAAIDKATSESYELDAKIDEVAFENHYQDKTVKFTLLVEAIQQANQDVKEATPTLAEYQAIFDVTIQEMPLSA